MSFFNDPASCGPSSSVQKLSAFASSSGVLNNEYAPNKLHAPDTRNPRAVFAPSHLNTVDHRLESDFMAFASQDSRAGTSNKLSFNSQRVPNPSLIRQQQHQQHQQSHQQSQALSRNFQEPSANAASWINDFAHIELNPAPQQRHQQHLSHPLSQQGTVGMLSDIYLRQPSLIHQQHQHQHQGFLAHSYTPMLQRMTEHQQVHHTQPHALSDSAFSDDIFEQAFASIDNEMNAVQQQQQQPQPAQKVVLQQHPENNLLSDIASKIANIMESKQSSQDLESKFKNSGFLKLMNGISAKQVGLSENGENLVDTATGASINPHASTVVPQTTLTAADAAASNTQKDAPSSSSGLPDPLSFLSDSDLIESSDQARNLINARAGDHILPRSADEIFSDYQHDDDF